MLQENLLRITYTHSSALGGSTTTVAEFDYEGAVRRGWHPGATVATWGQAGLLRGRVRVEKSLWRPAAEAESSPVEHELPPEQVQKVADALSRLRFGVAPFENPVLHVNDGWSGDLKIESGDVTLHAHWFLDPPPHFDGFVDLIDAITPC